MKPSAKVFFLITSLQLITLTFASLSVPIVYLINYYCLHPTYFTSYPIAHTILIFVARHVFLLHLG